MGYVLLFQICVIGGACMTDHINVHAVDMRQCNEIADITWSITKRKRPMTITWKCLPEQGPVEK